MRDTAVLYASSDTQYYLVPGSHGKAYTVISRNPDGTLTEGVWTPVLDVLVEGRWAGPTGSDFAVIRMHGDVTINERRIEKIKMLKDVLRKAKKGAAISEEPEESAVE